MSVGEALLVRPTVAANQFVRGAASWWLGELADMAPSGLHRPVGRLLGRATPDDAVLDLGGGRPVLVVRPRGRRSPVSVAVDGPMAEAREAVGALLRRTGSAGVVTIRLDPAQLFVTTLDLPRAAERTLDAVVRHQIERLVPLRGNEMRVACRIRPQASGPATLSVAVAVAKASLIAPALEAARGLGLRPGQVVAAVPEAGPAPLVLWQADQERTTRPNRRRLYRGLEVAALALALAAYGLHTHRLDLTRDGLREALAQATREAAGTRELRQSLAQSGEALAFLRSRREQPQPLDMLDQLTALLPLDTWVATLTVRGRTITIAGVAPRASDLIALIGGSSRFERAQFRSPITLMPDGRAERFDLSFEAKSGAGR